MIPLSHLQSWLKINDSLYCDAIIIWCTFHRQSVPCFGAIDWETGSASDL